MSLETPERIRSLQRKLYCKAKAEPAFRFYLLYDKIHREDLLNHAYALARANAGAPGVDGESFAAIAAAGEEKWLAGLRQELTTRTYRPAPVRRVMIPKPGGGERPLGIPTIRWFRALRSWCWSRSLKRTWKTALMAIGPVAVEPTLSRKCIGCWAGATPTWLTPIYRSTSTRSRIRNFSNRWRDASSIGTSCG